MKIKEQWVGRKDLYEAQSGSPIATRKDFISDLKSAIDKRQGYGVGRAGISEQFWMYYPIVLNEETNKTKIRVYEKHLRYHGFFQSGIFPAQPDFYLEYNSRYIESIRSLDLFGLILDPIMGPKIINFYNLTNTIIYFKDLIPDRSNPGNQENCYLHYFEDKRLLLICPFADLLCQRATKETFEGVWSKTGKPWFYPRSVDSLEFPYGFAAETQKKYSNALALLDAISKELERKYFDIALIAAAGLSVPIVSIIKRMGKIGIVLGGDLQVLFGVRGKRWRDQERWKRDYFNAWWIDMPEKYKPKEDGFCEGAYW